MNTFTHEQLSQMSEAELERQIETFDAWYRENSPRMSEADKERAAWQRSDIFDAYRAAIDARIFSEDYEADLDDDDYEHIPMPDGPAQGHWDDRAGEWVTFDSDDEPLTPEEIERRTIEQRKEIQREINYTNEAIASMEASAVNADGWDDTQIQQYGEAMTELHAQYKDLKRQLKATYEVDDDDPISKAYGYPCGSGR